MFNRLFLYLNITFLEVYYLDDDEKRKFWSMSRILFVLVLIVGIVVGMLAMQYVVSPYLDNPLRDELEQKNLEWKELQDKFIQCVNEKQVLGNSQS